MNAASGLGAADALSAVWIAAAGLLFIAAPAAAALGLDREAALLLELQVQGRLVYVVGLAAMIARAALRAVRPGPGPGHPRVRVTGRV